jgi:hypothetical protein
MSGPGMMVKSSGMVTAVLIKVLNGMARMGYAPGG